MVIRVQCECGKIIRIPDEHAGKKGKCPACGRVLRVPVPEAEGGPPAPGPAPPPSVQVETGPGVGASSLPWQNRGEYSSAVRALWETVTAVLFHPSEAFSHIREGGSLGGSILYVLIVGSIGSYLGLLWQLLAQFLGVGLATAEQGQEAAAAGMASLAVFGLVSLVVVPVVVLVGSFVGAGILHFCLWLVGGANKSLEATYAVVAYTQGSTALLAIIPFCGGLIQGIWSLIVEVVGLREAHGTSTGRALLAVLLPLVVLCGLVVGAMFLGWTLVSSEAAMP